jgi:glyoxylase-like metal-dependent hydrolase (beta-lactamase superfamily II)
MQASDPRPIDLRHLGRERVICAWVVGDVIVDPGPSSCLPALLDALGDWRPRALALTHIHLDHAGATGSLVRRWPDVEVWVHERGAPHLIDPTKLLASAKRVYGEGMDRLWGEVAPVPSANVVVLTGGERIGPFAVDYAPGHASHHVTYRHDSGDAFVGDVGGVRIAPEAYVRPPTPPPDIDIEAWNESLDRLQAAAPRRLLLTHFGAFDDPAQQITRLRGQLARWAQRARELDDPAFVRELEAEAAAAVDPQTAEVYNQAAPADQCLQGLRRYWTKRAQSVYADPR